MFWFAEEVDEATQQAVINCLKKNNPSYKGHNAIAFGAGEHDLEFKKNKFVTYTFTGEEVNTETGKSEETKPEETKPEETKPEETKPEETKPEETKPEEPIVVEPTLNYTVKETDIASWTVVDGVTAIYIAANGKIPAVVWTSVEVDDSVLESIVEELGADSDAEYVYGLGAHKIEYKHNKNKTKTVTYTFSAK
jgi:hypothetical protein